MHDNLRASFVDRMGLSSVERELLCDDVLKQVDQKGISIIRISFVDQHGQLRGKSIPSSHLADALANGLTMTSSLLLKDTSHRTVFPIWSENQGFQESRLTGAGDILMIPDLSTFKVLPWANKTAWLLCDIYYSDGTEVNFSTRRILRKAITDLQDIGFAYKSGLEVELHVFKLVDQKLDFSDSTHPASVPQLELPAHGYQYLTESRADELEPVFECIRQAVVALDLPLRSMEVEFGPAQIEFTFDPGLGMSNADMMILFRSAVKQVCRRAGYLATFMCRPGFENLFSSGWHIHQTFMSLKDGSNSFAPDSTEKILSVTGEQCVAGILEQAVANCLLTTPTVNGYKRYVPNALAPDRVAWAKDNKGAMLRVINNGAHDAATRIENRVAEPAANPYLVFASQIHSGLYGIRNSLNPQPPTNSPYLSDHEKLPTNMLMAIQAFTDSKFIKKSFGEDFVDYYATIKQAEFDRYVSVVSQWEQAEYLQNF